MSQDQPVTRVIDGEEYLVYKMDPRRAMRMLLKLGKCVGPSIGSIVDGAKTTGTSVLDVSLSSGVFRAALAELFDRLDQDTLESVMNEMSELTEVGGIRLDKKLSLHFKGRIGTMMKWLAFALEAQFGDFLGVLVGGINQKAA